MTGPQVVGQPAADRLLGQLRPRWPVIPPTPEQVAMVLRALADHTALLAALDYRPEHKTVAEQMAESPHVAHATSLGRWLHDTADQLRDR